MYTDVYCIQYNIILVLLDLTDQIIELLYNYTVYQIQILTQLDLTKSLKEKRQEIQLNVVGFTAFSVFFTQGGGSNKRSWPTTMAILCLQEADMRIELWKKCDFNQSTHLSAGSGASGRLSMFSSQA